MSDKTDVTMWVESLPVLEQIGGLLEFFLGHITFPIYIFMSLIPWVFFSDIGT